MDKLNSLRNTLDNVDGFILSTNDAFMGEYVPACDRRLEWLTGFTGSAGLVVILSKKAAFFTDGRYTLQAAEQVDPKQFAVFNSADTSPSEWMLKQVKPGEKIGHDSWLHSEHTVREWQKIAKKKKCQFVAVKENPIDAIWKNRPAAPKDPAFIHPLPFAGKASLEKRKEIAKILKKRGLDAAVLPTPDSVCWLLNIRGNDVPHTPLVRCFAVIDRTGHVQLFIDPKKISKALAKELGKDVKIVPLSSAAQFSRGLAKKKMLVDPKRTPAWYFDRLRGASVEIVEGEDPCQLLKACKNAAEIKGMKVAHVRDGVAVTSFLYWLESALKKGELTEIAIAQKLLEFRKKHKEFRDISFDTIAGFKAHGAIVHYRATEKSDLSVKGSGLLLLDSGAQYRDGTTDITRTIAIGKPTKEQRDRFTRVLKGHIAIARAKFPVGTTGAVLDALARMPLWEVKLDYDHGTGHGVGSYLSVHEGPQGIHRRAHDVALQPGMILSNEPGYYKEGEYGIRIENLVLVVECAQSKKGKKFLEFETLTLVPIDLRLVNKSLMTAEEMDWLRNYHQRVFKALSPYLGANERKWLQQFGAGLTKHMRGRGTTRMSTNEILALTRNQ